MSTNRLFLASVPVSAAANAHISFNLMSRACAAARGIDSATTAVQASLTVPLAFKAITTVSPFTVVDDLPRADIVLGSQWLNWCQENAGTFHIAFFPDSSLKHL
jgi:hypothetical protein